MRSVHKATTVSLYLRFSDEDIERKLIDVLCEDVDAERTGEIELERNQCNIVETRKCWIVVAAFSNTLYIGYADDVLS